MLCLCDRVYYKTNYQTNYLEKISTNYQLFPFPENQFQPNYQLHRPFTNYIKNKLIEHPALLYTNQVIMFRHSTASTADILNPANLAIIPQHINMVKLILVHKLSIVKRDPDENKAIYIQNARQSSVSTFTGWL